MNTNWSKILLFSLISFALGFAICRLTCQGGGCHRGGCGHEMMSCHDGGGSCKRGGAATCAHGGEGKASCCKGGGHGMATGHDANGVHAIVQDLEAANFQGDTTITIEGGTVNIVREGDKLQVKVNIQDSVKKEVSMEVEHGH
ncbi:MAG: hypothetical protein JNL43_12475 [Flavobacteriales bacterium]|nr:hypothetical protein [Flavobacteriales bacterium]